MDKRGGEAAREKNKTMAFIFGGGRPSGKDNLRDYQRKIASNARGMEREIGKMDEQEQRLGRDLVKYVKDSKIEDATLKAKELVRLRAHRTRVHAMKGHMSGLAQQLQTVQSTTKIQETIAITARMLQGLNAQFDAGSVARMLAEFEKQNILMTDKQEIVEDTLDSTFEVDGEGQQTNEAVLTVLQEAGLDVSSRLVGRSRGKENDLDSTGGMDTDDLDARLQRLREL